jgi:outer membrane lipoprotein-sorting protein
MLLANALVGGCANAQSNVKDANVVLKPVRENLDKVKDYTANARIKVDVDFVRIPDKDAVVYFKQPDKFRFKADGFAMLPKKGANATAMQILQGNYTAVYAGTANVNGVATDIVKVIPLDQSDVVLSAMWIDATSKVQRIETTTRDQGSYTIDFKYNTTNPFNLPSQLVINFDVQKMNIPLGLSMDIENFGKKKDEKKNTRGVVTVTYNDYKVNTGLDDKVFK